jgi:hypothetical protein
VLPFSTGVIMETLPSERIEAGLPAALADAKAANWALAAEAIMTTDTLPKAASRQLTIGGKTVTITGISKGAGMIRPNMATMLGFVATDAAIAPELLQPLVKEAADQSFNRITIDGDTSTNDSFVLIATQRAGHAPITRLDSAEGRALLGKAFRRRKLRCADQPVGQHRLVVAGRDFVELLALLAAGKGTTEPLFPGSVGGRKRRQWLHGEAQRLCKKAGVPVVCPHSLRGAMATIAVEAGELPEVVARVLGHTSSKMTLQHYIAPGVAEAAQLARGQAALAAAKTAPLPA